MNEKVYEFYGSGDISYTPKTKEERHTIRQYKKEFPPEEFFLFFKKTRRAAFLKSFHKTFKQAKAIWDEMQKPAYDKRKKGWTQW